MNKETVLQNQIILALSAKGCFARNHTVGTFQTFDGRTVKVGNHGEADIWGHRPDGKAFYIEVKLPGMYPREDQRHFLQRMKETGALSGVARSIDDAMNIINEVNDG